MLATMILKCFRKHEDLTIDFSEGLNTLRGPNEKGKTTLTEAMMYAWLGTAALREPLEQVVTYDHPVSALSVDLSWKLDGVEYNIVRSKKGAELRFGDQVITGQKETRAFMERQLGCPLAVAKLLMFAGQNEIRGVLQGGDAGNLVEKLAGLDVIDDIIAKIGEQLPSGNTKQVEAQVAMYESAAHVPPTAPSNPEIPALQEEKDRADAHYLELSRQCDAFTPKKVAAEEVLAQSVKVDAQRVFVQNRQVELEKKAVKPGPCSVTPEMIDQARYQIADASRIDALRASKSKTFPELDYDWDESEEALHEEIKNLKQRIRQLTQDERDNAVALATKRAMYISETTCSLCKKDLTEVPEVAVVNKQVEAECAVLEGKGKTLIVERREAESDLGACEEIVRVTAAIRAKADDNWKLSDSLPPRATWIGGEVPERGAVPDIKGMEATLAAHRRAVAAAEAAEAELTELTEPAAIDTTEAQRTLEEFKLLERSANQAFQAHHAAAFNLRSAQQVLQTQQEAYEREKVAYDKAITVGEGLKKQLADMQYNNALVKKLRDLRPEIRDQVWNLVLGAVSYYFSQIRGEESAVTREGAEFKVNGRSIEGLSGSTLDSLGLGIRVALSKTFLPGIGFQMFDEPFAGCDENRELAGLGTIAAAGFEQVLLITHSDLADALSDKVHMV